MLFVFASAVAARLRIYHYIQCNSVTESPPPCSQQVQQDLFMIGVCQAFESLLAVFDTSYVRCRRWL